MKNRFVQLGIVIGLICIYFLYIKLHEHPSHPAAKEKVEEDRPVVYSPEKIIDVFKKHDIRLKVNKEIDPELFQIDQVAPKIFSINNNKNRNLFVYIFDDTNKRKDAGDLLNLYNLGIFFFNHFIASIYESWNALIVDTASPPLSNLDDLSIDRIVFKDLNQGKVRIYKGESAHWKGTFTLNYYFHIWKDENGTEQIEDFGDGKFSIRYKKANLISKISYDCLLGSRGVSSEGNQLDQNGILNFEISHVGVLGEKYTPKLTLKWDGLDETILFKANKE
ncbi:MAG: hypothetical protein ACO1OC_03600 [Tuberibacillus sp.]